MADTIPADGTGGETVGVRPDRRHSVRGLPEESLTLPQLSEYTIVIPAYNEEQALGSVLNELAAAPGCREIIVVDDGSTDRTAEIARQRGVHVIAHPYNRGYGASLKTGIQAANTSLIICCDGDGQHHLADIMKIAASADKFDMVVGARDGNSHKPLARRPGKRILGWFANLLAGRKIPDLNSGLRSFRTATIRRYLHMMPDGFSFSTTSTLAMFRSGASVEYVPISTRPREGRGSSVKFFRDGFGVLMLIVNLTVLFNPMRVFLPLSFAFFLASLIYFATYWIQVRLHVTESMVLLFTTGVILFFMGIVCEQVSAIRREGRGP